MSEGVGYHMFWFALSAALMVTLHMWFAGPRTGQYAGIQEFIGAMMLIGLWTGVLLLWFHREDW